MMPFALQQCQLLTDLPPIVHDVHSLTPDLVTWRVARRVKAYGSVEAATALTVLRVTLGQVWGDEYRWVTETYFKVDQLSQQLT
jgi:hypothetical protein